jgi:hypothetical protein
VTSTLHQFQSLCFLGSGLGFGLSSCGDVGFGFSQVQAPCYLSMLHFNRGKLNFISFYNLKKL